MVFRGHNLRTMSDLQCAATLLFVGPAAIGDGAGADGDGDGAPPLSAAGREQAAALARSLRGDRVAAVYCSAGTAVVQTAEAVASALGIAAATRAGLDAGADGMGRDGAGGGLAATLEGIVDVHRGETVLIVSGTEAIEAIVPLLARNVRKSHGAEHPLGHGDVVAVAVDADGWVVRSWAGERLGTG